MRSFTRFVTALTGVAVFANGVQAISKITRTGRYLYDSDGNRFYIKGIAYQEQGQVIASASNAFQEPDTFTDPLTLGDNCNRDVKFLTQLGVNTIRVYSVNSTLNHDACMKAFSAAGIYTLIDLSLPRESIDRLSPAWTTDLLNTYISTIDSFSGYDNVLGYNVGNEVVIAANGTGAAAFVKAAGRDVKAYLKAKSLPGLVGYAAIDGDPTWRNPLADFLSCDPSGANSDSSAIDLYGLNNYEWCGDSTFADSYQGTTEDYAAYNVVAYFSEYGCVTGATRTWSEVVALFGKQMTTVWSGGIAFSYFPAASAAGQFGMVTISSDGKTVTTSDDFTNLQKQYNAVAPAKTPAQSSAGPDTFPTCQAPSATFLASNTLPPTPVQSACDCLEKNLSCRFTPQTTNQTIVAAIVGSLLDYGCSLLGQTGGSCVNIAASGATGTYGLVSSCDPETKLSYVMTQFYEGNNRNAASCSFAGNGTVNSAAPSSASAVNDAAASCLSSASGAAVPVQPSTAAHSTSTAGTSPGAKSGALSFGSSQSLVGVFLMVVLSVVGGVVTLA